MLCNLNTKGMYVGMNNVTLEALGNIFTIENGMFKILLVRKKKEPYKGYWILPSGIVTKEMTIEETIDNIIEEQVGLSDLSFEQSYVFSDLERVPKKRVIGVSLISIVDEFKIRAHKKETSYEISWFSIDQLPKIGYDHSEIVEKAIAQLKDKLNQSKTLQQIFPSDFTLPEIQKIYEQVLTKELDRRNFRKKFLKLNLIEETGDKASTITGRPAKLYRFKQDIENVIIF